MSLSAYAWAWKQQITPHQKIVLLVLADCYNDERKQCNPSRAYILKQSCVNKATFAKALSVLVDTGLVSYARQSFGKGYSYTLHFGQYVLEKSGSIYSRGTNVGTNGHSGTNVGTNEGTNVGTNESTNVGTLLLYGTGKRTGKRTVRAKPKRENDQNAVDTFETFWTHWPKKTAKKAAARAWLKIKDKPQALSLILINLEEHANANDWDNPQYIPNPATYLNGEQWHDTVYKKQQSASRHRSTSDTLNNQYL